SGTKAYLADQSYNRVLFRPEPATLAGPAVVNVSINDIVETVIDLRNEKDTRVVGR
ncbi:hypothetical protein J6590_011666, partial [Homalodisca vitripennis]